MNQPKVGDMVQFWDVTRTNHKAIITKVYNNNYVDLIWINDNIDQKETNVPHETNMVELRERVIVKKNGEEIKQILPMRKDGVYWRY